MYLTHLKIKFISAFALYVLFWHACFFFFFIVVALESQVLGNKIMLARITAQLSNPFLQSHQGLILQINVFEKRPIIVLITFFVTSYSDVVHRFL